MHSVEEEAVASTALDADIIHISCTPTIGLF